MLIGTYWLGFLNEWAWIIVFVYRIGCLKIKTPKKNIPWFNIPLSIWNVNASPVLTQPKYRIIDCISMCIISFPSKV